jgi:hypothetical protein
VQGLSRLSRYWPGAQAAALSAFAAILCVLLAPATACADCSSAVRPGSGSGRLVAVMDPMIVGIPGAAESPTTLPQMPCNGPSCSRLPSVPRAPAAVFDELPASWAWRAPTAKSFVAGRWLRSSNKDAPLPVRRPIAVFHPPPFPAPLSPASFR